MGDGTWGEGISYEALNMASLWQVPLLVVVENQRCCFFTVFDWMANSCWTS